MNIGVFEGSWWGDACAATDHTTTVLPNPRPTSATPRPSDFSSIHAADIPARLANGPLLAAALQDQPVDFLLDNSGAGLAFVVGPGGPGDLKLLHETLGKPLISHFIDPLVTAFQGLGWETAWQCMRSNLWVKAVWDRAQAFELASFGIPHVVHLPMAAPDRHYDTTPLDPQRCRPIVSFVGGQNTSYFAPGNTAPTSTLLPGALGHAALADGRDVTFYDIYHNLYGMGTPVLPDDPPEIQLKKTGAYFASKLYFNAALCLRNRDRFVIFLKRHLGDTFELIGNRWDTAYGLPTKPPIQGTDAYLNHFRETAININLVNGNGETGLNMRHFEITAAGGFMLCYDQPELRDCFEVGRECEVFNSESELLDKVQYYLSHPLERVAIALAGQRRTLSQHLYSHRLATLVRSVRINPPARAFATTRWIDDLKSLVPNPDVVLDCGANIGQAANSLRSVYPEASIYSFEPVSAVYASLVARCETLRVHPVRKAVSDHDGRETINLTTSPEAHSLLGFQEGNPCAKWTKVVGTESVDVCTIDNWCHESGIEPARVDVIKLDVQGAELKALQGARTVLKTAKAVYAEVSFVPIYKDTPLMEDIDSFMQECGFTRRMLYPSDQPHNWGDALYVRADAQ